MIENPYFIQGPALIGVSGGRTSGMLFWKILEAHNGSLPDNIRVSFANTGKEHKGTLEFVRKLEKYSGVKIHWVEFRVTPAQVEARKGLKEYLEKNDPTGRMVNSAGYEEVSFDTASRNGEPFSAMIALKNAIPNGQRPFCSAMLKIIPAQFLAGSWGWSLGTFIEPVGLRADEKPGRVAKARADANKFGRRTEYPLADAGIKKPMVRKFWDGMPFDLEIPAGFGNCDLCFKKGLAIREKVVRADPDCAPWWIKEEARRGYTFDGKTSVAKILTYVRKNAQLMSALKGELEDYDEEECGQACLREGE